MKHKLRDPDEDHRELRCKQEATLLKTKSAAACATAVLLTECHTGLTLQQLRLREPRRQEQREPPRPSERLSCRHGGSISWRLSWCP